MVSLIIAATFAVLVIFLPESKTNGGALTRRILSLLLLVPSVIFMTEAEHLFLTDVQVGISYMSMFITALIVLLYIGDFFSKLNQRSQA